MPRYLTPLMVQHTYELLELHMGIGGKRLSQEQMTDRGYSVTLTESQIITTLPMGGPDGYYKVCSCLCLLTGLLQVLVTVVTRLPVSLVELCAGVSVLHRLQYRTHAGTTVAVGTFCIHPIQSSLPHHDTPRAPDARRHRQ